MSLERGLDSLYREVVMDHHRHPRGAAAIAAPSVEAKGHNPSCGDEVRMQLEVAGGRIRRVAVLTQGCAVSRASGSMLAELVEGLTVDEARRVAELFRRSMHGESAPTEIELGDLEALTGVRQFPVRIKCALLPWVTMLDALLAQEQGRAGVLLTTTEGV